MSVKTSRSNESSVNLSNTKDALRPFLSIYRYKIAYALVEGLGEISGSDDNHSFILQESVHLYKQLIESLLHVLLVTRAALAADGVELVNEYNRGLLFPRRRE
jgi:hypothetical protein